MSTHDSAQAPFLAALEAHRGILVSVAAGYCRDNASREDVVQSIVTELWHAYPRYDGRVRFSTWMYRIAVNTAISYFRRSQRHADTVGVDPQHFDTLAAPRTEHDERRAVLDDLLASLDELQRALVVLYLDGNSYAEIAGVLGISETNVATKLSRIKERLRKEHDHGTR